ncbi:MAG: aminotransferase class I/II-fold pyridoxal phosphate-dependent enzyme [Ilumatobacteraceae bacterium]
MGDETDDRNSPVADPSPAVGSDALAREFEDAIRVGTLGPGDRLPTVRALACERAVAPGTVAAAYRTLAHRGDRRSRAGRDVRVESYRRAGAPGRRPAGRTGGPAVGKPRCGPAPAVPIGPPVRTTYGRRPSMLGSSPALGTGWRDKASRMDHSWRCAGRWMVSSECWRRICAPVARSPSRTPGTRASCTSLALGLGVVPVRIDAGMVPEDWPRSSVRCRPSSSRRAQNPTGAALTAARAARLTATWPSPDVLVVHDDHSGDVSGVPLELVGAGDGSGRPWALVHSFAKTFGPDWRIAVVTGDDVTVDRVDQRFRVGPGWVSHRLQRAIGRALTDPARRAEIERATASYALRRRALVTALDDAGVSPWPTAELAGASGWNVWVAVPEESEVVVGMAARGWAVLGGARFRHRSGSAIRCSVAALPPERATGAARALADVLAGSGPRPV